MNKKIFAVVAAAAMLFGVAGCGHNGSGSAGGETKITIFNSKNEIQPYLEDAAEQYSEDNGVDVEVYYSNDTVAAHLATKYASKSPYTINMVDAKDVYSLGKQYGLDLSREKWNKQTDYALSVGNKVIGFPVCIEARGLLYNADAIKKVTGKEFNPDSVKTLDDFKKVINELKEGGMKKPVVMLKEDWSLAAHYLQQVYEERANPDAFVDDLLAGKANLADDAKFNSLMDTFDVLRENNKFSASPITAEGEQVHRALSTGEAAFQFGGNWDWNDIIDFDYTGHVGIMPVPQDVQDDYSGKLVGGGSKFFYIDNSPYTTKQQQTEAKKFLNWLVDSKDGQTLISKTSAMVSPFKNNTVKSSNDLGVMVKKYADKGKLIPNYNYDPDDHYTVVGAYMQKYLAKQIDRSQLADQIEAYWKKAKAIEH